MLQIGVIQFVQKWVPTKKLLSVKKNDPLWSPGAWEYVESVRSSPVLTRNTWIKIVSNLNSIPDIVRLVDPKVTSKSTSSTKLCKPNLISSNGYEKRLWNIVWSTHSFHHSKSSISNLVWRQFPSACGGYSTDLWVWWYLSFPDEMVQQTLLYLSNNEDETFISINCLEYVMVIINYCASITSCLKVM